MGIQGLGDRSCSRVMTTFVNLQPRGKLKRCDNLKESKGSTRVRARSKSRIRKRLPVNGDSGSRDRLSVWITNLPVQTEYAITRGGAYGYSAEKANTYPRFH